jgi:hypothetical protein
MVSSSCMYHLFVCSKLRSHIWTKTFYYLELLFRLLLGCFGRPPP